MYLLKCYLSLLYCVELLLSTKVSSYSAATSRGPQYLTRNAPEIFYPAEERKAAPALRDTYTEPCAQQSTEIEVSLDRVAFEVDETFLSIVLGIINMKESWVAINLTAPRTINLAAALNPAMLRLGGKMGDFLLFSETSNSFGNEETNFTVGPAQWDAVNKFVQVVGWEFIFGLNSLLRNPYPVGVWDSTNAAQLMAYSSSKGYTVNWELGNEPNRWKHFGYHITPEEHAADFAVLKELIEREKPAGQMIVGPDAAGTMNMSYFEFFLQSVDKETLTALTYHHYYSSGKNGTLAQFYDVKLLDSFISTAADFKGARDIWAPGVELWIGETASMFAGGTPHISNTYVAGFMWMDKLGIAALMEHKRVFREDFMGDFNGLLDPNQNPTPDYWLSVLYKRLVGTRVLYITGSLEHGRYLRAYAHCAKAPYPAGSVVMLLLNMNFSSVSADLVNSELSSSSRDVYWLTPPTGNLTSTSVQLNGQLLQLVDSTELPDLKPTEQPASTTITLPPISFGFSVFKDTKAPACMS